MKDKTEYITSKSMMEIDKEIKLIPLTFDFMFKGLFMNDLELLKEFIIQQLGMNLKSTECKIELLNSELPKENKKEYKKIVDIYVSINNFIYTNIEVNREYFKDVKLRNMIFADKLYSMMLEQGENASELNKKIFFQINLNAIDKLDKTKKNIELGSDRVVMYGLDSKQIYTENKCTLVKYLEYYRNLYYNEKKILSMSEMWLVVLTSKNFIELYDTLGTVLNDDKKDKFIRKVIKMSSDKFIISEWEKEKLDELVQITKYENAIKEGIEQGIEQGRIENRNEIVINMLKENLDINLISKITGLEEEEIIKIQENL